MSALNTKPIFPVGVNNGYSEFTTADNSYVGTGAVALITAAGLTRVDRIECHAIGTNVASVARFFVNNGASIATAGNNAPVGEIALPATTASTTLLLPVRIWRPRGHLFIIGTHKITANLAVAVAGGWRIHVFGDVYES